MISLPPLHHSSSAVGRSLWLALAALTLGGGTGLARAAAPGVAIERRLPENRAIVDIPPGNGIRRNSEGAFLDLRDGRLMFVYSQFFGATTNDNDQARLAARYSSDGGETWSADAIVLTAEGHSYLDPNQVATVLCPTLLRMQNGDIGLFYELNRGWHDLRMQLRRSADEGRTWSEPVQCMPMAAYWNVENDRVVRLSSGRLIIPANLHRQRADFDAAWPSAKLRTMAPWTESALDNRGIAFFFLSDDDGRTWREAPGYCVLPVMHTESGLQETGLVELPGGALWAWARTDLGRQYEFFSLDGGENWTQPEPSRFTSPNSPLSMKRIPGSSRFLAIWNPAPNYETRPLKPIGKDRTPLVGAIGEGPGGKWSRAVVIEGEGALDAAYIYTAIHFTKDAVLLAYSTRTEHDTGHMPRLRIRKLSLDLFK